MALATAKKLASRIKMLREKRGLTQEQAARKCRMEYKYYQRYESSQPRDMRLSTMEKISSGFGISLSDLLDLD